MYLSSKHQSRGDLGRMRYPNRVLSKYLPLCTCNYPFHIVIKRCLNHRVNFGQFKICTDIEKNPGPSVIDATKTIHAPYCQGKVTVQQYLLDNNVLQ